MKIAMWSGPRNLSTALMYAFASRPDFTAIDEPFYGPYLRETGLAHPMREEVLESVETDQKRIVSTLLETDIDATHQYQKHMTQHMLNAFPLGWMTEVTNVFLIRHPARVLSSWQSKHDVLTLDDFGFTQQASLYNYSLKLGQNPVIVDASDIRANPEATLRALCDAIDLDWDPAMLSWPAGPKPYDGIWAAHWYDAVHRSTGFAGPEGPLPPIADEAKDIFEQALPIYERFAALKLTA